MYLVHVFPLSPFSQTKIWEGNEESGEEMRLLPMVNSRIISKKWNTFVHFFI